MTKRIALFASCLMASYGAVAINLPECEKIDQVALKNKLKELYQTCDLGKGPECFNKLIKGDERRCAMAIYDIYTDMLYDYQGEPLDKTQLKIGKWVGELQAVRSASPIQSRFNSDENPPIYVRSFEYGRPELPRVQIRPNTEHSEKEVKEAIEQARKSIDEYERTHLPASKK